MARRIPSIVAVALATAALFVGLALQESQHRDLSALVSRIGGDLFFLSLPSHGDERLATQDIEAVLALPEVAAVAGQGTETTYYVPGQKYVYTWLNVTDNYLDVYCLALSYGRPFLGPEERGVVIGAEVAEVVFGHRNPIGETLEGLEVIGVLARLPEEDVVREYLNRRVLTLHKPASPFPGGPGTDGGTFFALLIRASQDVDAAEQSVLAFYPGAQILPITRFYSLSVMTALALNRVLLLSSGGLLIMSGALILAVLSLSALRRAREIGIRRAVGASVQTIQRMLLGEAFFLSLLGGLSGSVLGVVVLLVMGDSIALSWLHLLPVPSAVLIGILAAWLPACSASRRSPASAIAQRGLYTREANRSRLLVVASTLCIGLATCALVILTATTQIASRHVSQEWGRIDADLLLVRNPRESILPTPDLTPADAEVIKRIPDVVSVVPTISYVDGSYGSLALVGQGFGDLRMVEMISGRMMDDQEIASRQAVCLISDRLAEEEYGGEAVGRQFQTKGETFQIVGQFARKQAFLKDVILPLEFRDRFVRKDASFLVRVASIDAMTGVANQVVQSFQATYPDRGRVTAAPANLQLAAVADFYRSALLRLSWFALVAIALGIGEISTLAHFFLSLRTFENGVRRAIGAKRIHVILRACREMGLVFLPGIALGTCLGVVLLPVFVRTLLYLPASASLAAQAVPPALMVTGVGTMVTIHATRAVGLSPAELLTKGRS